LSCAHPVAIKARELAHIIRIISLVFIDPIKKTRLKQTSVSKSATFSTFPFSRLLTKFAHAHDAFLEIGAAVNMIFTITFASRDGNLLHFSIPKKAY
jgi:hypothetical protein